MVRTLLRGCRCAASFGDLDLTFDLATFTFKLFSGLYHETMRCSKMILGMDIG